MKQPLDQRGKLACQAWALDGYGTPPAIYGVYLFKVALYIFGWAAFCSLTLGPLSRIGDWWLQPLAFQKAILFSALFEVLGLGCGSGPLTGRYMPPVGGALYFLRPGTTKLPLFPGAPLIGRDTRSLLDVGLYFLLLAALVRGLIAPALGPAELLPLVVLLPVLGVLDKTL